MKSIYRLVERVTYSTFIRRLNLERYYCSSFDDKSIRNRSDLQEPILQELLSDSALGTGPLDEVTVEDDWRTSPYPKGAFLNFGQSQSMKSLRPKVDPRDTSIIMFPGIGSQHIQMGRELLKFPAACDIFNACCDILEYDLVKLMMHGPKSKLDQIKYAEPAIFACSLAALEKLKEERPWAIENCVATAGFGVGEIAALTFAGVFKFGDGLKLVRTRAEAIHLASQMVVGGMAMVHYRADSKLSTALQKAREWCSDRGINNPVCQVAVYLNPTMKIISGHVEALEFLETNLTVFKLRKIERIPLPAAFQTNLLKPAADAFAKVLDTVELSEPSAYVYSNITGKKYVKLKTIKKELPKHIYKPILWEQLIHKIFDRADGNPLPCSFTCGPRGLNLRTTIAKVNLTAATTCIALLK